MRNVINPAEKTETLHKLVSNILFAKKIARPEKGKTISYLMTRVKEPYQIDWLKMVHLFKYVRGTKNLHLILSEDNIGMIKC